MVTLSDRLDELTRPAELLEKMDDDVVRCLACAHRCLVNPGRRGICKVRFNRGGTLMAPWGYVAALQMDPIEKKPFAHVFPGSDALTFGMLGCDFHCDFCQNWLTSQTLRDPDAGLDIDEILRITPQELTARALRRGADVIVSSYNEPLITSEWAVSV